MVYRKNSGPLPFEGSFHRDFTEELLDILKEENVRATFFILGLTLNQTYPNYKRNRKLLKRMDKEGHTIASHTFDHKDLTLLDEGQRKWEIVETEKLIWKTTHRETRFMRPPDG